MNQLDMFPTELQLRRIDPSRNMRRYYALSVQRNLFGEWVLLREWGRIGYRSRVKEAIFPSPGPALDALQKIAHWKGRRGYQPFLPPCLSQRGTEPDHVKRGRVALRAGGPQASSKAKPPFQREGPSP